MTGIVVQVVLLFKGKIMLKLVILIFSFLTVGNAFCAQLYDFSLKSTENKEINLKDYKGKNLLIVNIATRCGYTGQLDDLEKLYKKYSSRGLVVIGVPSNDFASQSPGSDKEVASFCRRKYGVTFPLATKSIVSGRDKIDLVKYILKSSSGSEIQWNFEKFLFNSQGEFVSRFSSSVEPLGSKLEQAIKKVLN